MITFRELAEIALADKRRRVLHSSYKTDCQRTPETVFQFGALAASDLAPARIEDFLKVVQKRASGATANRFRSLISSFYSFGLRSRLVASNPVEAVPRFRESEGRIRFLDVDEEAALRAELAPRRIPELDLALHTGLRKGEQYGLKWADVSLERGTITTVGKGDRLRTVPLNDAAAEAIRQLHVLSRGSELVCPGNPRWWFEAAVRRAGIQDLCWHALRHTFASRMVMAGANLRAVQELLGHARLSTTQRYAHVSDQHLRSAVEKLAEKRGPQLLLFQKTINGL